MGLIAVLLYRATFRSAVAPPGIPNIYLTPACSKTLMMVSAAFIVCSFAVSFSSIVSSPVASWFMVSSCFTVSIVSSPVASWFMVSSCFTVSIVSSPVASFNVSSFIFSSLITLLVPTLCVGTECGDALRPAGFSSETSEVPGTSEVWY